MIPFFRKIRYRLAKNNQFFKYSRYAIGEIVLVVVGILIALYINNWNEQRKEREKYDRVLVEVEKELVANILECRRVYEYYYNLDSIASQVIHDSLTIEHYKNVNYLQYWAQIGTMFTTPKIRDDAFKRLVQILENKTEVQDSLISGLFILNTTNKRLVDNFSDEAYRVTTTNENIYQQFAWYKKFRSTLERDEEMLEFLVNDHRHLNAVIYFSSIVLENLRRFVEYYEIEAVRSYRKLYKYLEANQIKHLDSLHFEYTPNNYEHYLGTYMKYEITDLDFGIDTDSTVVSVEDGKLFYTPYYRDGGSGRREIIPVNKYHFRTELGTGYFQVVHDSLDQVVGLTWSNGVQRDKDKKIR